MLVGDHHGVVLTSSHDRADAVKEWLVLDAVTDEVLAWQRSSRSTSLPGNTAEKKYIDATGTPLISDYGAAQSTLSAMGIDERPKWNGTAVVLPADRRRTLSIVIAQEIDSVEGAYVIDADGIDELSMTITVKKFDGTDAPLFDGLKIIPFVGENGIRRVRANFTNGNATKAFKANRSGEWRLESGRFRVLTPLTIICVDP